jgi:glycosyltransferase involved in cell wall biosynthesis
MKLSIVIPAYNEEACLAALFAALDAAIQGDLASYCAEVVIVDDHSSDRTAEMLAASSSGFPWLKYVRLLKNSGSHVAIFAGLSVCTGDVAFVMGADLQDSPDIIPRFVDKMRRDGKKIVLGERLTRNDPLSKVIPSRIFHFLMSRMVMKGYPANAGDVFLLHRDIVDAVLQCNEKNANIFVLMLSICDDVSSVPYDRQQRIAGESKWNITKLLKLAFDSVITVGYLPLKVILWSGILTSILALLTVLYMIFGKLGGWIEVPGWASVMVLVAIFGGVNMISIAIIGEYLWRNFDQTRQRPMFIIESGNLD